MSANGLFGILDASPGMPVDASTPLICQFAAPLEINSVRVSSVSDSMSLKRLVNSTTAQRWEVSANIYSPNKFVDFFVNQISSDVNEPVLIRPPLPVKQLSDMGDQGYDRSSRDSKFRWSEGSATTETGAVAGGTGVQIGMALGSSIYKGDFLTFSNHTKLYMVKHIERVGVSSSFNLTVYPSLKTDIPVGTELALGLDCAMVAYYDIGQVYGMKYSDGVLADPGQVKFVEKL